MRSVTPQKLRSGKASRKAVMNALMSSRPRRGSCSEYFNSMSGAAISSTMRRSHFSPQKLVNQRPTTALLSSSFDMFDSLLILIGSEAGLLRLERTISIALPYYYYYPFLAVRFRQSISHRSSETGSEF